MAGEYDWMSPFVTALGGYLGARGSQGQTQTQSNNPYFQPYQEEIAQQAQQLYSQPAPQYQGQTWAGPTQNQMAGWDMAAGWAGGTPQSQALQTAANQLAGGNPFQATQQTANFTRAPNAQWANREYADNPYITVQSPNASNSYIGQTTGNISGVGDAYGRIYGELPANSSQAGVTTANAVGNQMYGMNNPYTNQAVDAATQDVNRQFSKQVMPQLDRMMQQSGSFGNTGVQDMQKDAMSDYTRNVGNIANDFRYKDLFAQQQLGESDASRRTGVNLANAGAYNTAALQNAGSQNQFSLGRAGLLGGLASSDLGRGLQTQQFNAGLGQADLGRNANLMQNMSQFNVGNQVGDVRQMQNLAQQQKMFNAEQGNAMNRWNVGQTNDTNRWNAGAENAMNIYNAGQGNDMSRFNTGMNWNAYNTGLGLQGQLDNRGLQAANVLTGVGGQQQQQTQAGLTDAQNQWQQQAYSPYSMMNNYANLINSFGGNTQSQFFPGNPWLGALGGGLMGNRIGGG